MGVLGQTDQKPRNYRRCWGSGGGKRRRRELGTGKLEKGKTESECILGDGWEDVPVARKAKRQIQ